MKVAILHEGSADKILLRDLLKVQGLDEDRVSFYCMGSKSNFFKPDHSDYSELIPSIDADQINKVLFTVDADFQKNDQSYGGYENSIAGLRKVASDFGIEGISQFYAFCDPDTQEGTVEALLLSTLREDMRACIDHFLDCSNFKNHENSKALFNLVYKTAYPKAPYNLDHPHFDDLKQKLTNLFT